MRELIVTQNITVDGVIDAAEGWFSVISGSADTADLEAELFAQSDNADAFLTGRVTFEEMRGYWPKQTGEPTSDYLNKVAKYVVSGTMTDPEWANSTVLPGLDAVRELKSTTGKDIVTTGSIQLVHALNAAGLVDEYRLYVYPVVLGQGRRLFSDPSEARRLTLVSAQAFRSGVTLLRYRVSGVAGAEQEAAGE